MSDYQDENPYASPLGAEEPAAEEIRGIWRDGDELVVLPRDMQAPRACWVTNRTRHVRRCTLMGLSWAHLATIALLFIPCIGLLLYPLGAIVLGFFGYLRFRNPTAWLGWSACVRQAAGALVGGLSIVIAVFAGMATGLSLRPGALLVSLPFIAAAFLSIIWADRLTIGLHVRYGENGTFRIRGVHPDYLARLPAYPESDAGRATAVEPGDKSQGPGVEREALNRRVSS